MSGGDICCCEKLEAELFEKIRRDPPPRSSARRMSVDRSPSCTLSLVDLIDKDIGNCMFEPSSHSIATDSSMSWLQISQDVDDLISTIQTTSETITIPPSNVNANNVYIGRELKVQLTPSMSYTVRHAYCRPWGCALS